MENDDLKITPPKNAIEAARRAVGNISALAERLGIGRPAIYGWMKDERIPAERLADVERVTGIPRWKLRPDLYDGMILPNGRLLKLPPIEW